jgi:RHH-type proline utilization regulon transcriptional repressor/proline dehydrogenase/delta 1-pyrroline-5-carboxylate dehydrogenase
MVLAEALLRVPDALTQDRLIEDKLKEGGWSDHETMAIPGSFRPRPGRWDVGAGDQARRNARRRDARPGQADGHADGAHGDAAGDAVSGASFRARRNHRGCAWTCRQERGAGFPPFLRHARRGRAHWRATPSAISNPMPMRSRPSASPPTRLLPAASCLTGPASRSSSRRCIRAISPPTANRCSKELVPDLVKLAQMAKAHDLNFTIDAEEVDRLELSLDVIDRAFADPSLAGWDGFRPRHPGLPEARAAGDRPYCRSVPQAWPPDDGAAGQGRLLGHRDQAGAGARA